MTADELLNAINAAGLTADQLTGLLSMAGKLVQREAIRAEIAKARAAQQAAHQQYEANIQALEQQFAQVDASIGD